MNKILTTLVGSSMLENFEKDVSSILVEFILNQRSAKTGKLYLQEVIWFFDELFPEKIICKDVVKKVSSSHLVLFRKKLEQRNCAANTVNKKLAAVSAFYSFLKEKKWVEENPCLGVKRLKVRKEVKAPDFSNAEVENILAQVDRTKYSGKLHYAALSSLFFLGLRCHELTSLRIGSFLKSGGSYFLEFTGKGGRERIIPLPKIVLDAISEYLTARDELRKVAHKEEYLFMGYNTLKSGSNHSLASSSVRYILERYAKKAGVTHRFSTHSTRATFIGAALERGIAIDQVAKWVDHQDVNLTKAYSKRKDLQKTCESLVDLYGGKNQQT